MTVKLLEKMTIQDEETPISSPTPPWTDDDKEEEKKLAEENSGSESMSTTVCANCETRNTPLWRRDNSGRTICNACGLYYKLHLVHRPATMMRTVIKRRKRCSANEKAAQEKSDLRRRSAVVDLEKENENEGSKYRRRSLSPSYRHVNYSSSQQSNERNSNSPPSPAIVLPPLYPPSSTSPSSAFSHLYDRYPPSNSNKQEMNGIDIHVCSKAVEAQREYRNILQREVTRLTAVLSDTVAMLQTVDNAIANPTPPGQFCQKCTNNNDIPQQEQQVARSLLFLAHSPPKPSTAAVASPISNPLIGIMPAFGDRSYKLPPISLCASPRTLPSVSTVPSFLP